jgi:hypothetical protein
VRRSGHDKAPPRIIGSASQVSLQSEYQSPASRLSRSGSINAPVTTRIYCRPTVSDLRLHISGSNEQARYIALNHYCWGGQDPLWTLLANLREHPTKLRFDLQKTRHQVRIYGLILYEVSIIQDPLEDWAREAASMGSVMKMPTS